MRVLSTALILVLFTVTAYAQSPEGRTLTRKVDLEARFHDGDPDFEFQDLADIYGIYNLLEYRRYAQEADRFFGRRDFSRRADIDVAFGLAGIVWGQVERRQSRRPTPKPAKARMELSLSEHQVHYPEGVLEVRVKVRNTGWHELRFENLEQRLFLLDREGLPVAAIEVSPSLAEPFRPGQTVEGVMTFPFTEPAQELKLSIQGILGEEKEIRF